MRLLSAAQHLPRLRQLSMPCGRMHCCVIIHPGTESSPSLYSLVNSALSDVQSMEMGKEMAAQQLQRAQQASSSLSQVCCG